MSGAGQLEFTDTTCDMARYRCQKQGLDFVSCSMVQDPIDPMNQVTAVCREPSATDVAQRQIVGGFIGALSGAAIFYFIQGKKGLWKGAAVGGFLGLIRW